MKTTEKLAEALRQAGAPEAMINRARNGYYDDYESPLVAPITQLVQDARGQGIPEIAERAIAGEFDGTPEEGAAWWQREGSKMFPGMLP